MSTDPDTGERAGEEVVALNTNRDADLTNLTVITPDNRSAKLHTTQHHPFWSVTRRDWVDARDLVPGELLHGADGRVVMVLRVDSFIGSRTMRDLTVDRIHTYYVAAGHASALVHNCDSAK